MTAIRVGACARSISSRGQFLVGSRNSCEAVWRQVFWRHQTCLMKSNKVKRRVNHTHTHNGFLFKKKNVSIRYNVDELPSRTSNVAPSSTHVSRKSVSQSVEMARRGWLFGFGQGSWQTIQPLAYLNGIGDEPIQQARDSRHANDIAMGRCSGVAASTTIETRVYASLYLIKEVYANVKTHSILSSRMLATAVW